PYLVKITFRHNTSFSIVNLQLHLANKALFLAPRFATPALPLTFGFQTIFHLIFAIFFFPSKFPHRKFFLILSIFLRTVTGAWNKDMKYIGNEDNTAFVRTTLPAHVSERHFHPDNFILTLSMIGSHVDILFGFAPIGIPK
ncbi:hypothetical protein ES288_A05G395700v1, partial [Gossypium darwinii]